jgi:ATP-binding cassette subfamily B protein
MHGGPGGWMAQFASGDRIQRQPLSKVPWRRIGSYFQPYWFPLVGVIFVIAAAAIFNAIQPVLIQRIVDDALPHGNMRLLDKLTLITIALVVVSSLLGVLQTYTNAWIGEAVMNDLRVGLYKHLQINL